MFMKWIARALAALNSNAKKEQIAAGIACGVLLALVPSGNLLWIFLFGLFFFFKIHYGLQIIALAACKLAAPLFASGLDALGWAVLHSDPLQPFFVALADAPIAPLTRFNNTVVMGGLVAGIALWLPLFFAFRALVALYRARLAPRIAGSKAYGAFMKIPLVARLSKATSAVTKLRGALE
ncbi:MAG: DUF2062 domain-containing protein [Spirochaetae bacterium HGW-Spirochaetae-3]|jgi:uncharacterized protein (TIGR03546 family)|nr:MAG: DUF2062 domain-containing protein [Spirochaetae bacterium HGW-Spirochaetae-3]